MGSAPRWFGLVRAAQFYQCMPWELVDKPAAYIDMALMIMDGEAHAREMQEKSQKGTFG